MIFEPSDVTVLIIDDEPMIRDSIAGYLEDSGFATLEAENGRVGLEVFRNEKPDIILVDLRMPEVDGLDVLAAVREASAEMPIIVVSGTGVLQDAIEALRLGAWDYISKPMQDMAVLEYAVQKALERAKLLVENRKYREHLEEEIKKRTSELEDRTYELEMANERLKNEIAEHKRTSEQLRHAQKMEAIGTLAGGIAHDFNNILFPIFGYTQMAMEDVPEESIVRKNLESVLKSAKRAKDMVHQILAFSRQGEQEKQDMKLQPIVKETLKLLRATLPATIEIRQNINQKCEPVLADPTQIHQVIMNLCTNAYHAMRQEGGVLEVSLDKVDIDVDEPARYLGIAYESYVRLTVSDTGRGMTKEVVERIFEPYFTTKDVGEGTGLGLSVVHGIVKSHNGRVSVHSKPDKGTVFHVYLPMIRDNPASLKAVSEGPHPQGTERILLVDDEKEIIFMEKQMLERLGYHVTAKTLPAEALELFRDQPEHFDLVISDMNMPKMTGIALAKELMLIRPGIPLILCTGFSEIITEEDARAEGIRGYVMKPVLKSEIAKTIRRVLDESEI